MSSKGNIPILLLEVLKRHSSENHRLTQTEIKGYLTSDFNLNVDRKTVIHNLMNLVDDGFPLRFTEHKRSDEDGNDPIRTDWYIERDFSETELTILADMVKKSRIISREQSAKLLEKIGNLGDAEFASKMKFATDIGGGDENNVLFENVELLTKAIASNSKVHFNSVGQRGPEELNKYSSGKVKEYKVSPYKLVIDNDIYYLVGATGKLDKYTGYRVDRIVNLEILPEKRKSSRDIDAKNGCNTLDEFIRLKKYQGSGDTVRVEFRGDKVLQSNIRDWFNAEDILLLGEDETSVTCSVKANCKTIKYWAVQYCKYVEIISPKKLREDVKSILEVAVRRYGKE